MEVYADFRQKVQVNPKDVVEKLIESEIGCRNWIFEKKGKYYVGSEQSAGCHSFDNEKEITQEIYEYVMALQLVLKMVGRIVPNDPRCLKR